MAIWAKMSGFETIEALACGDMPAPAMADVIPYRIEACAIGEVILSAHVEERYDNLFGVAFGGFAMTLLDYAMGFAAVTALSVGEVCPSTETSVKFLRALKPGCTQLRITGRVLAVGRTLIHTEGRIDDEEERIYALGTSSSMRVRHHVTDQTS